MVVLCEVFDGENSIPITKPVKQQKLSTRDLDPVMQELMLTIAVESPLYLSTRDAFPDHSTDSKSDFCSLMVRKAARIVQEKGCNDRKIDQIKHITAEFKTNKDYRKLVSKLVSPHCVFL